MELGEIMRYPLLFNLFIYLFIFINFSRRLWDPSIKFWGYRDRPRPRTDHLTRILPLLVAYTGHEDWRKQTLWKKFLNDNVRILV